jgi:hypothetical protein
MRFDKNTCHALAKSVRASSKVADALRDRSGVDIAIMNVPTILAIFGAAAGKLGHAGIEARRAAQGKPTIATRVRGGFNRHGRQGWESRAASCVDGPRLARVFSRDETVVACSHVSGLQCGLT